MADDVGRYNEAVSFDQRSMELWEKIKGPESDVVAEVLSNLAGVYLHQGRYSDAEPLYKRALAIREKALGRDHILVASTR